MKFICLGYIEPNKFETMSESAEREVSQGADTAVWLALDAPQDLTGKFLRDLKVIAW